MVKLNQILAVEKGAASRHEAAITNAYHTAQKPELFGGQVRTYTPKDDEGEQLPGEVQKVQVTVPTLIGQFTDAAIVLFDANATKKWANCTATGSVVIDGFTLASDVPVEYLLFLEKRLADVLTFLNALPTLDPKHSWEFDDAADAYVTEPVRTNRSRKELRNHVKAEATDKHPAQVETFTEDVVQGYWDTTYHSGAVPVTEVNRWRERVAELQAAVKMAREEANSTDVAQITVGKTLFDWIWETQ